MKKRTLILLAFQASFLLAAAQKTIDRKYEFPVKPGSGTWRSFTTHKQMVEATKLPEKIATSLTTKALLETCLDYPLLGDIMLHNSPQRGLEVASRNFNGLQQLMERKDVALHAANTYQKLLATDVDKLPALDEKGKLTFQLSFIELLLSQKSILATVDKKGVDPLRSYLAKARSFKTAHTDVFGVTSYGFTMLLAGNLHRHFYQKGFSKAANEFLNTGSQTDASTLEEIDNATR